MAVFNGTINSDTINGSLDHDLINGNGGSDLVKSFNGNDTIYTGAGDDTIFSGNDNDLIYSGSGNDLIDAGSGHDKIFAGSGKNTVEAGSGHDTIMSGEDEDLVDAGSGNDVINTGAGDDTINAKSGDDLIHGKEGNDYIDSDDGNDTVYGGDGNDYIIGDSGNDSISGGADNGSFDSKPSDDEVSVTYRGGETVSFANTFGYYIMDDMGNPTVGKILFAGQGNVALDTVFNFSVPDATKVGFFIIPNGDNNNAIVDGDDVTFGINGGGDWAVYKGPTELVGSASVGSFGDGTAFFSNPLLNSDSVDHENDSGAVGNYNWEDLLNGGDMDYNDINLDIQVVEGNPGGFVAGDTIDLDSGNDLVVYFKGIDGVDLVTDFGYNGIDKLRLVGAVEATTNIVQDGTDVLVSFDDATGGLKLEDTTVAYVTANTEYV